MIENVFDGEHYQYWQQAKNIIWIRHTLIVHILYYGHRFLGYSTTTDIIKFHLKYAIFPYITCVSVGYAVRPPSIEIKAMASCRARSLEKSHRVESGLMPIWNIARSLVQIFPGIFWTFQQWNFVTRHPVEFRPEFRKNCPVITVYEICSNAISFMNEFPNIFHWIT